MSKRVHWAAYTFPFTVQGDLTDSKSAALVRTEQDQGLLDSSKVHQGIFTGPFRPAVGDGVGRDHRGYILDPAYQIALAGHRDNSARAMSADELTG